MAEIRKALELDPLSPIINVNVGDSLLLPEIRRLQLNTTRKPGKFRRVLDHHTTARCNPLCYLKMYDEAMKPIDEYAKVAKPIHVKLCRAYVDAHMGNRDAARRALVELESDKKRWRLFQRISWRLHIL